MNRWTRPILAGIFLSLNAIRGIAEEVPFQPIFDGRSLAGWQGQDMSFWTVEDGAITGSISPAHRPPMNQYLVWQGGLLADFELKLEFRLTGSTTPDTNGGFQFRSRRLPNGDVAGYQVDNNFGQPWRARLYDEFGRHDLAREGEYATFDSNGNRKVFGPLNWAKSDFRLDQWHEYHLVAIGHRLSLRVNGTLIAEARDDDADSYESFGILALQLHTGPPMKAQFRSIRLKKLNDVPADSRDSLIGHAALHWDLGERPNAHQPPLVAAGRVLTGPASGEGARPGVRVAKLDDAFIHAKVDLNTPKAWNVPGEALTVHARARIAGERPTPLFAKGQNHDLHFRLGSENSSAETREMSIAVRTSAGVFRAAFPLSRVSPGAWHDFVGRYDGKVLEVFCDGQSMAKVDAHGALLPSEAPILIGAASDTEKVSEKFTGEIEEVNLWTRRLSDREIQRLIQGEPKP